jgi:hypothetical protein
LSLRLQYTSDIGIYLQNISVCPISISYYILYRPSCLSTIYIIYICACTVSPRSNTVFILIYIFEIYQPDTTRSLLSIVQGHISGLFEPSSSFEGIFFTFPLLHCLGWVLFALLVSRWAYFIGLFLLSQSHSPLLGN